MVTPEPTGALPLPELPRPRPEREVIEGRYVRLEPLSAELHYASLLKAVSRPGEAERFRYLFEEHPDAGRLQAWFAAVEGSRDPFFHAVVDRATGRCGGRQALMRIVPEHGVIELGSIYWGPEVARTRLATEAFYLSADHVFRRLGYRRLEWKCDALNAPSRKAALRFGFRFEGVFEQHMVVKGKNRDTAWFALLDHDWRRLAGEFERWLEPANFDGVGKQRTPLAARRPM